MEKGKTKYIVMIVAAMLILGVLVFMFAPKQEEPKTNELPKVEESIESESEQPETQNEPVLSDSDVEDVEVDVEESEPPESMESEPNEDVVEEEKRDIAAELKDEGNAFEDEVKPISGMEIYNGNEILSTQYIAPFSTVQVALQEEKVDWGGINLLKGEFNYYVKSILGFAKDVTEQDNVEGKNVVTVKLKDYYSDLSFDVSNIPKIQEAYKHSVLYSEGVDFLIEIVYPDGSVVTY